MNNWEYSDTITKMEKNYIYIIIIISDCMSVILSVRNYMPGI